MLRSTIFFEKVFSEHNMYVSQGRSIINKNHFTRSGYYGNIDNPCQPI